MITWPSWAVYLLSFGSPVLSFLGVLVAQRISRRGANELETRSKREEVMRTLRWAAELSVSDNSGTAGLGVAELNALADSRLLDEDQKVFIDAALESVIQPAVDELGEGGDSTEVVESLE